MQEKPTNNTDEAKKLSCHFFADDISDFSFLQVFTLRPLSHFNNTELTLITDRFDWQIKIALSHLQPQGNFTRARGTICIDGKEIARKLLLISPLGYNQANRRCQIISFETDEDILEYLSNIIGKEFNGTPKHTEWKAKEKEKKLKVLQQLQHKDEQPTVAQQKGESQEKKEKRYEQENTLFEPRSHFKRARVAEPILPYEKAKELQERDRISLEKIVGVGSPAMLSPKKLPTVHSPKKSPIKPSSILDELSENKSSNKSEASRRLQF